MKIYFFYIAILFAMASLGCGSGEPKQHEISVQEADNAVRAAYSQFVDVRTPEEYLAGHADRAVNIPLDTLEANLDRLKKNEPVYLICQSGNRSQTAADILTQAGFTKAVSVAGGTPAWQAAGLPMSDRPPSRPVAKPSVGN